ncbi:transposase [Oscillibacter valericigenes]|uniref:transposase n=1 Tax=Oscillibacter valericigenes TaxID=351091 RepID=UPI001F20B873|nr:transposase [Oscillibacter valericigenes]MCF2617293.1 transposase [Oscillibacter valericigenes]
MMETKVFADDFSCSFSEPRDFFQFLGERKAKSKWMTAPSKDLRFEPVEKGSALGDLYMKIYDHNGAADVLEDTMENTSLLLKVDGKDYPVRSCAIKTVLERARISGHALNKVSKTVFAEILNYCMGVASGDSLIKIADQKVSAVHGGDPKDYTVMEMLPLFKAVCDYLDKEYPGNQFMTAHFDHTIATAIWRLDGQADQLLDTYRREVAAKGLNPAKLIPALRFSTSDVGMSGANLYPILLAGNESRIIPLGYPLRTQHKSGYDMEFFEEQLGLVYAQFEKAVDKQVQLLNIEIRYPVTTLMRVLKRIGAPKKASYEAMDYFVAIHGDDPCTAYELFMQMSDVIFSAQCDGASGLRIAQLEEIVSRALNVNWHEYDHPGDFKW